MSDIGTILKRLREENGFTGKEVVEKLKKIGIEISDKTLYGYESGRNSTNADMFLALCQVYKCQNIMETFSSSVDDVLFTNKEWEHIEKYRSLDPYGQETVSYILDREADRIKTHGKISDHRVLNLIELSPAADKTKTLPYWQEGAAAGNGIYQLNDTECIQLKLIDNPVTRQADFIINVSGKSMEPDYHDGDKVLVSQKAVVQMGEVGIFIKNGKSYIKELGTMELISRNPESDNISVNEFDNVVCMGKVIGKVTDDMIIPD